MSDQLVAENGSCTKYSSNARRRKQHAMWYGLKLACRFVN